MKQIDVDELVVLYQAGKSMSSISRMLGCDKRLVRKRLAEYGLLRSTRGGWNLVDIAGKRFGRLFVLERVLNENGTESRWLCRCDCGTEKTIVRTSLVSGSTTSCGCARKEKAFRGVGDLSKTYWNRIVKGAKKRNLTVEITIAEAWERYLRQDKLCALSGTPIQMVSDYTRNHQQHTASLDRIDNTKGYIVENIQWVHRDLNMMRRDLGIEQFIVYCRKVTQWADCHTLATKSCSDTKSCTTKESRKQRGLKDVK